MRRASNKPRSILINRTPLTNSDSVSVIQDAGTFRVACKLYNRDELINDFIRLGYRLVSAWDVAELKLDVPASPAHSIRAYSGLWFELAA